MDQPLSYTAVDPVFNNQARVVHKVRFVVGHQRHPVTRAVPFLLSFIVGTTFTSDFVSHSI